MTNLLLSAMATFAQYAKNDFVRKTRQPMAVQERFLQKLLQIQQGTALGQQFGLGEIRTIAQFQEQVPIWSYAEYEPYTQRVVKGEPNVLTADPVVFINLTSGTTGKQKMVPVTHRFSRSLGKSNTVSLGFAVEAMRSRSIGSSKASRLEFGKVLSTNFVGIEGKTEAGIDFGPVTVGSYRINRFICEQTFAQPFTAMEIANIDSRHYVCLLFALCNPQMRGISANFPMLVLRTCQYLEQYAEALIEDIERGTIASWLTIAPEIRVPLERQWSAHPKRAQELRQILRSQGKLTPKLAWSKLSFVGTARGGTSDFYFERFPDYFGDTLQFGGVYGTAEGTFAICHDFNADGSILSLESGFYEFIPEDQWDAEHPKTLLPEELKVGDRYRILVTSYSGFYRYDIGDVIEVVGFYEQTPMIIFRHRRGGLLSSVTEKTTEFHAVQTLQALQQEFGLKLEDFCITLATDEFPSGYWVNIELPTGETLDNSQAFLMRFDHWMGEFNSRYAVMRSSQIPTPRLRILAPGSFAIVRQRQLQRGTSESQLKIPHISEDRRFLEGLEVVTEVQLPADLAGRLSQIRTSG
ncbi:MAG: GH3 auxin-responsive promoter family protein [Drouetiella hepatica Uher 2000/2452]|jgi:acyl-CoA synthetase (AMP-forming)/AMP-acid ligase II|uniref:GH3 auxin-responsive promoter family protein n=1 Tax=Drouetiella hepatica Uher 2000/2452 TaxID=904376 RepID=A0A951UR31_9CYAN|nr:GH3 auxin-responsive promoter family protein [Drouetiella hepatica Uher 2000/2452]